MCTTWTLTGTCHVTHSWEQVQYHQTQSSTITPTGIWTVRPVKVNYLYTMAVQVTINSLTGTSPYDVYVCDSLVSNCVYIATINSTPYVFDVPAPLDVQTQLCVKVVDTNGCIITQCGSV